MRLFLVCILYIITTITYGLVLKTHDGKLIRGTDLGAIDKQHHIHNILSDTLYSTNDYSNNVYKRLLAISNKAVASDNPIINPVDYGADPTGTVDSTAAFQAALKEALSRGAPNVTLADGIHDCGGATINLMGGDYLISETLTIPPYYGNLRITDGTLRANKNFSASSYMIVIGSGTEECTTSQKSCNEYINIDHFFCDCKQICFGCIHVFNGMSTNVGPQTFYLGYNGAGITTTGGHSLFLLNSWFGEYLYSDPRKGNYADSTATSIVIDNYDNLINDVIVYSSRIGVNITKGASTFINVHTWNLATKKGGMGIVLTSAARLINCYLDYNDLVLFAPIQSVSVQNTFFLGSGTVRLVTTEKSKWINGLSIVDSQYSSGNGTVDTIVLDTSNGLFGPNVENIFIKDVMILSGYNYKSTRITKKLTLSNANKWVFNFKNELLFANVTIKWVDYTFQFENNVNINDRESITHYLDEPNGMLVTVNTNKNTSGTVYITVDQSYNQYQWV